MENTLRSNIDKLEAGFRLVDPVTQREIVVGRDNKIKHFSPSRRRRNRTAIKELCLRPGIESEFIRSVAGFSQHCYLRPMVQPGQRYCSLRSPDNSLRLCLPHSTSTSPMFCRLHSDMLSICM